MAYQSIVISNRTFENEMQQDCKILSPTQALVGDWECSITSKGVICTCEQPYGLNSKATLKYTILTNGLSRLVLIVPGSNPIVRNKKWLTKPGKFCLDGILILSDGDINRRYAKFKVNKQQ